VGCDELSLLNQTDRKLMRQIWGEPAQHSTAHDLYREFFDRQERRIAAAEKRWQRERQEWVMAEIDAILEGEKAPEGGAVVPSEPPKRPGFLARLFGGL
ncbi:MAG TPA: hypothetical protein VGD66_09080, partial [Allosphingosinicella sp.]